MSLEDDILQAQQELLAKSMPELPFVGNVQSADPLQVVVDGTSVPLPAFGFGTSVLAQGDRVVVLPVSNKYYVLGSLGAGVAPEPDVIKVKSNTLLADTNYGTSPTVIVSVDLTEGTWNVETHAGWSYVGATDQHSSMTFTGIASMSRFEGMRWSASANAGTFDAELEDEWDMGQTTPQALRYEGGLTVTVPGTLSLAFRRTAGTSGTVRAGAGILATLVQ